jgi:DNA-binding NtrC family response regulator
MTTNKPTILVVDDEATLRVIFADQLSGQYRCVTAANALDALQTIEANVFELDMLVTDIVMPGQLNGLHLANKVREKQPNVAILLITGYAQSAVMKEAQALGYRVLEKPFRLPTLHAAIEEELAKRPDQQDGQDSSVVSIERARQKRDH